MTAGATAPGPGRIGHLGRRTAAGLALSMALATGGCLNFQEPEELEARRGELLVQLVVTDTTPTVAALQARLTRERREDGTYRPLEDSTIRVLGRAVAPDSSVEPGFLFYGDEWIVSPAARAAPGLELLGPLPDGGSRVSLAFPLISRAGPDSLELAPGEDLSLPVDPGSEELYGNVPFLSWTMVTEREGSDRSLFILRGSGRPPDTLRIQRELLEPDAGGAARTVRFWVRMDTGPPDRSAPYDLRFALTTVLEWTVTVEGEQPATS